MLIPWADPVGAEPTLPQSGEYEITLRLELPHVERWAVDRTTKICLPSIRGDSEIPIPVLSANTPFGKCGAKNHKSDGTMFQYDIVCPGRDAAKAYAKYKLVTEGFSGFVAMILGAKNMTMVEHQHARRIGGCPPAVSESQGWVASDP
jgi:hypothetical protein